MTHRQRTGRKPEAYSVIFAILGAVILSFIILTISNMIVLQFLADYPGFVDAVKDPGVWRSIWLSIWTAIAATLIALVLGVPLAYMLARRDFMGKGLVEAVIDVPVVIPHTVAGIALLTVFGYHGLIGAPLRTIGIKFVDMELGIIIALLFVSVPFMVNSAREGFQSIDPRLENIARSLGASGWGSFCRVSLPLAVRQIVVGAIMTWARAISEFGAVVVIAYYPMIAPTLIYERYISFGLKASRPIAVLLMLVCLLVFVILRIFSSRWKLYDRD